MDGILCIDKPAEITSFVCCAKARRILGEKKAGHAGTLDPMATGVLPILIGKATRALDLIPTHDKRYTATMQFGFESDTLDIWGNVRKTEKKPPVLSEIEAVLPRFRGDILQVPPMTSALKKDGKRLYELARQGIEVERQPRPITVYALEILDYQPESGTLTFDCHCSKGTYIRSICDDIGRLLGCGAVMTALRRTMAAGFSLSDCVTFEALEAAAEKEPFIIKSIKTGTRQKNPAPPFITSTLQQDASRRFGFQAKRTMKVAQELYEGINLPDLGAVGLITYMRTDSLRISDEALSAAHDYIQRTYGENYALAKPRTFRSKSNAQDGHEAIRPTMIDLAPAKIKESLSSDQYKLYKLVWERFIASQMAACVQDTVSTDITAGEHLFKASGFSVRFDGYTRLYTEAVDNEEEQETNLPRLEEGEHLTLKELKPNQHFTQPPPRYTEATLIRELEENGIGRPSTYAPTLSTILQRGYVEREGKALKPTIVGETVTRLMKEQFGKIVDVKFTAEMEQELDEVEAGKTEWVGMMHHFYDDFTDMLQSAEKNMEGTKMKIPDEETDIVCELCGRKMVVRHGKYGKFLACPGFPECKNTKTLQQETPGSCPRCGKKVLAKKSKTGRTYYGCEDNPKCGFMTWDIPLAEKCPQCGSSLFKTTGRVKMIHCLKEGCGYEKSAK